MAFDIKLADRIRDHLANLPALKVEEKKMFRGLTFMVNGKMCINVSNNNLMCRYDPVLQAEVAARKGYQPMIMKGRQYKGYCYVNENGYKTKRDFGYWLNICLQFNDKARASKPTNKQ